MSTHTFIAAAFVYAAVFHAALSKYATVKQRAWILTALGSFFLTIASLPFIAHVVWNRGEIIGLPQIPWWSENAVRIFQAYLFTDLLIGSIYYPTRVTLLMGWFHHTAYLALTQCLLNFQWTHIFCLAGIMELPTFHLAIASLHPHLRHDGVFAVTFFSTRIALHAALFALFCTERVRFGIPVIEGSFAPAYMFAAAFPMHVVWFYGCISGMIRRSSGTTATAKTIVSVEVTAESLPMDRQWASQVSAPEPLFVHPLARSEPLLSAPARPRTPPPIRTKLYPPSTHTLPTTFVPSSPPRSPLPSSSSFKRTAPSSSSYSAPSSVIVQHPRPQRPGLPPRRRSLTLIMSPEREESIRQLAASISALAAQSPRVQRVRDAVGETRPVKAVRKAMEMMRGAAYGSPFGIEGEMRRDMALAF